MAANKIPEDVRLYVLHLVSLGVPRMTVGRRYGFADSSIIGWQRVAAKPRYTQCSVCGEWIVHRTYGGGNRRKYCEGECQRVMRVGTSQSYRESELQPVQSRSKRYQFSASFCEVCNEQNVERPNGGFYACQNGECKRAIRNARSALRRDQTVRVVALCVWCFRAPRLKSRKVCSDDCYRQRTNHRLAHGTDLWCLLPLCSECGLVKGINNMAGECRDCLATSSRRRESRRLPTAASCELCGESFFAFGRGWSKPKFCEECRSAKRLERQRLGEEAVERRRLERERQRLEREALPRPLCKLCLSIVPISRQFYCSKKCQRMLENHYRHYGVDLWRVLPLCRRCGLVKGVNQNPGYCRECKVIANREAKRRQKMNDTDPGRKEFYRSGDKITRQGVLDRTGYRCHLCKRRVRLSGNQNHALYFEVDHIIPRSKGGTHTWDNVATCCRSCNGKKGNRAANDQLRLLTVGGV